MKLIKLNPKTPGTRHQINLSKNLLSKNNFIAKSLNFNLHNFNGRSSDTGHITSWHRGGGCKRKFKNIKFSNDITQSIIISINYDSYRSSFTALAFDFVSKKFQFLVAPHSVFPGSIVTCSAAKSELNYGFRTTLLNFSAGNLLYNLSLTPEGSAKYSRAAGTYCQLIQKNVVTSKLRIPSGKIIEISSNAFASLGRVSNLKHNLTVTGKAGRTRLKGFRPIVRGIAMNPVDHPHGGRTNGGRPSVTPWGILTKNKPTVKKKKHD